MGFRKSSAKPKIGPPPPVEDEESPTVRMRNLGYTYATSETRHPKKKEDKHTILSFESVVTKELCTAALIADGHNGDAASTVAQEFLLHAISARLDRADEASIHAACTEAFGELHERCLKANPLSGSTVTVCLVNATRREVTCANVGDTFAILVPNMSEFGDKPVTLSTSHRMMDNPEEMERVKGLAGVEVKQGTNALGKPFGDLRAWPGGLAVVRGVGDGDCGAVVSCVPSCKTVQLPPMGCSVVLASDGVWDSLRYSAAASIIRKACLKKKGTPATWPGVLATAKEVVGAAISKAGLMDDTTATVLYCPSMPEFEEMDMDSSKHAKDLWEGSVEFMDDETDKAPKYGAGGIINES
mmetsp:Transcript_11245/g.36791  ORF Transcript_11245/g.36791 Transcript_11245/m.36791 type:complete len:357 (-) Transcript_11245:344-1414(-)